MTNQLQKAINLSKKTGDRLIVFDRPDSDPYVVMSLDDYEKLAAVREDNVRNLTEKELLDKINRDVAIWKSENSFGGFGEHIGDFNSIDDINSVSEFADFAPPEERDFASFGDLKKEENKSEEKRKKGNNWAIPSDRKQAAEEVDEEEDRQYLEEIPF